MISRINTNAFGPGGLELNFYVNDTANEDVAFVFTPEILKPYFIENTIMPMTFTPMDAPGMVQQLLYIGYMTEKIYKVFILNKGNSPVVDAIACQYNYGIQTFVGCVNKFFSYTVLVASKKVAHKDSEKKLLYISIDELFSAKEKDDQYANKVWYELFGYNENFSELFHLINWINKIYSNPLSTYTNTKIYSSDMPAICAISPAQEQGYRYVFHNHSFRQVIVCLNEFIDKYFNLSNID